MEKYPQPSAQPKCKSQTAKYMEEHCGDNTSIVPSTIKITSPQELEQLLIEGEYEFRESHKDVPKLEVLPPRDWRPEGAHHLNNGMTIMSMMDFARFLDSLPPAPPVIPITDEQMESWFQPWEIIIKEL